MSYIHSVSNHCSECFLSDIFIVWLRAKFRKDSSFFLSETVTSTSDTLALSEPVNTIREWVMIKQKCFLQGDLPCVCILTPVFVGRTKKVARTVCDCISD